MRSCSIEGCGGLHKAKGYCQPHYVRWKTTGDPQADKPVRTWDTKVSSDRVCFECEVQKPISSFGKNGSGYRRTCIRCHNIKRHGLSYETYTAILESQGGKCAACFDEFDGIPNIDHDHQCCSGKTSCGLCVRGLLCTPCNLAEGYLRNGRGELVLEYIRKGLEK